MNPRILLTNDDGIESEGLNTLCLTLEKEKYEVYVVAPTSEKSASSHSLTLHTPLKVEYINSHRVKVDGTPTDCVMVGILDILQNNCDMVISGINKGPNLGDDINYSGTVAAAKEGTLLNIPSMAISLVAKENFQFKTTAEIVLLLIQQILKKNLPKDTLLNVNVPNLPLDEIKGIAITRQGKRIYENKIVKKSNPDGKFHFWIGGDNLGFLEEEKTDFEAITQNKVSITPLHLDMTNYKVIKELKDWDLKI